jgi:hypothetical protein
MSPLLTPRTLMRLGLVLGALNAAGAAWALFELWR